jgi:hypothetical protein
MGYDVKCGACGATANLQTSEASIAWVREHARKQHPPKPAEPTVADGSIPNVLVNDK